MDDDFLKKLILDLNTSGFASEMGAIQIFLRNGWNCSGSANYFDKDEKKTREIDLAAYRLKNISKIGKNSNHTITSSFHIIAEVKKTDKPWIVFRENLRSPFNFDAWNNLVYCNWPSGLDSKISNDLSKDSLLSNLGWRGYGIHESFKRPEQPSRWYSACISVAKASQHQLESELSFSSKQENLQQELGEYISLTFVQPLIIVDGMLLSAQLNKSGNIEISEIDAAPLFFSYRSIEYGDVHPLFGTPTERNYRIDIVRLASLNDYIERCGRRQQTIMDAMQRTVMSLD